MFLIVLILVYCLQMKWKIWSKADYTLKIQSLCLFFGPRSKIASKLVTPNLKIPFKPIFSNAGGCTSSRGLDPDHHYGSNYMHWSQRDFGPKDTQYDNNISRGKL